MHGHIAALRFEPFRNRALKSAVTVLTEGHTLSGSSTTLVERFTQGPSDVGDLQKTGTEPDAVPKRWRMYESPVAQAAGDGRAGP